MGSVLVYYFQNDGGYFPGGADSVAVDAANVSGCSDASADLVLKPEVQARSYHEVLDNVVSSSSVNVAVSDHVIPHTTHTRIKTKRFVKKMLFCVVVSCC